MRRLHSRLASKSLMANALVDAASSRPMNTRRTIRPMSGRLLVAVGLSLLSSFSLHAAAQRPSPADGANERPSGKDANPPPNKESPLSDGTKEEARSHFQRGIQFYADSDYKLALVEFRRAYELSHNFRILYNIGQVNQQLGNYSSALVALELYLRDGGEAVPEARRTAVLADQTQLRAKVAQLDITVNVENAEVLVDDVPVMGKTPLGRTIVVDAGDHRVEVRRDGYQPAVRSVTVAGRETAKVDLRMTEQKAVVVVAPTDTVERQAKKNTTLEWIGWISAGAMAVGAGVTGAIATSQASQLAALRDSPTSTATQRETAYNQARGFAMASDVLAVAALATGGAALYLTLRPHQSSTGEVKPTTRLGFAPNGVLLEHRY